jgi:prevent-host-death family protein
MSPVGAGRPQDALAEFRNRRGEPASSFTATDAKKQFGRVLDMGLRRGGAVIITKHDAPKAIILSMDEFNALAKATERTLDTLSADFDAMLARMQTPRTRAQMKAAFGASPKELGKAAVAATRKRRPCLVRGLERTGAAHRPGASTSGQGRTRHPRRAGPHAL